MKEQIIAELLESAEVKRVAAEELGDRIAAAAEALLACYRRGGKVLLCGNGGSAADCQHLATELVARYRRERRGLPAVALTTDTSLLTALANDYSYERVFARQVEALGQANDVLIAISTSGRSASVNHAVEVAHAGGLVTIGLTGCDGGRLAQLVDLPIVVPSESTARIQECHITIGHILCEIVESALAPSSREVR